MILAAITTHKREPQMVERAIKSVVNQTYQDWHLVVVDDSPADYEYRDSVKRMAEEWCSRDSRITYIQHDKNYGAQRARNTALKFAENTYPGGGAKFIAYLDDDDEWLPEKLERQLARFNERDKNTALVYCRSYLANTEGEIIGKEFESMWIKRPLLEGNIYDELIFTDFVGTCTNPLIRTECLKSVGGWDESMPARQDWETWLRLARRYEFGCVDKILLVHYLYSQGEEHVAGNPLTQAIGFEKIRDHNKDRYAANKTADYQLLNLLIRQYRLGGQYKKCIAAVLKAVYLQPLKLRRNARLLLNIPYIAYLIFKDMLRTKYPELFYWLKRRVRGERIN